MRSGLRGGEGFLEEGVPGVWSTVWQEKQEGSNDQGKGRESPAGPGSVVGVEGGWRGSNGVWVVKVGRGSPGPSFCGYRSQVCIVRLGIT